MQHKLIHGDCREIIKDMESNSVDLVLSDPPYFIDGMGDDWDDNTLNKKASKAGAVGGLPVGMKFDPKQGIKLQAFMTPVFKELMRVLKPGGFMLICSSPRLYHRMAISAEDVGFEIRDQYVWRFTKKAQMKAFSMNHFVAKSNVANKDAILKSLNNRKTPQLRPNFESIMVAQKPKDGTFLNNWEKHNTGLIDVSPSVDGKCPSTVMTFEKNTTKGHLTPKPVELFEHIIKIFSLEKQMVLDPFVGSGTTCLASLNTNRRCVGIDINADYIQMSRDRCGENATCKE